jgi:hypothetical protein
MRSTTLTLLLIVGATLLANCTGDENRSHQLDEQILNASTQVPLTASEEILTEDQNEGVMRKLSNNPINTDSIVLSQNYRSYWRPRQRRRRWQRLSNNQPQWLATIQSLHNQNNNNLNTNTNNFNNNNLNNKFMNNEFSDENSDSLLPARHIRRSKQTQSTATKSSKSSQQSVDKETVNRGPRATRQYDIPQIGQFFYFLFQLFIINAICFSVLQILEKQILFIKNLINS